MPYRALRFGDLDDPSDPVAIYAREKEAKPFKEETETRPSVLYVKHEKWMEEKAATGIQLNPDDDEIIYEQR